MLKDLKCLLTQLSKNRSKMQKDCIKELNSRKELWKLAEVGHEITSLIDVYLKASNSKDRNFFLVLVFASFTVVFILGILCSRPSVLINGIFIKIFKLSPGSNQNRARISN